MVNNRKFTISGGLFSGFNTDIDLDTVESKEDLIFNVINNLQKYIKNMPFLVKKIKEESNNYHIHDIDFGSILISNPDTIFYVCNHC